MVMVEGALRLAEPSVGLGGFGGGVLASPKALEPPKREAIVEVLLFLGGDAMVEASPGAAEPKRNGGLVGVQVYHDSLDVANKVREGVGWCPRECVKTIVSGPGACGGEPACEYAGG